MVAVITAHDPKLGTESPLNRAEMKVSRGTNERNDNTAQQARLSSNHSAIESSSLSPGRKAASLRDITSVASGTVQFLDASRSSKQSKSVVSEGVKRRDTNGGGQNIVVKGTLHVLYRVQSLFSRRKVNRRRTMTI